MKATHFRYKFGPVAGQAIAEIATRHLLYIINKLPMWEPRRGRLCDLPGCVDLDTAEACAAELERRGEMQDQTGEEGGASTSYMGYLHRKRGWELLDKERAQPEISTIPVRSIRKITARPGRTPMNGGR